VPTPTAPWQLPRTQATVLDALGELPIELTTGTSTTSVVGSDLVVFDEGALPAGVALYARMALQALA
jgi:hypothetical protein